jgi:hypothetical protein
MRSLRGWIWIAAVAFAPLFAGAQVTRAGGRPARPRLTLGDTLTVSASPSAVSFALAPGAPAAGSTAVTLTTSWTGVSLFSSIALWGYFVSSTQALSGGSPASYIPSSEVLGKVPTGAPTSFTAFTQSGPLGGAGSGLLFYFQNALLSLGGYRTDSLSLEIDLTAQPQLPAATYTGTIMIQAQAF